MDNSKITSTCCEIVQWACKAVSVRAAQLAACAVAAVVVYTGNDKAPEGEEDKGLDVGLDGSYVYPKLRRDGADIFPVWLNSYLDSKIV